MKKFKLLSLALALCMFFSCINVSAQTQADADFTPIGTQAFDAMKSMGLISEEFLSMDANSPVTRAQFMGALYKLTGLEVTNIDVNLPFADVNNTTSNRDAIAFFYSVGAVSGASNSAFNPDEYITYTQAVKVISDFLGYKVYVQQSLGGYPGGYLAMAVKLGLDEGLAIGNVDDALTAQGAVSLVYNAATASMSEAVAYKGKGEELTYSVSKGKTPLSVYNSICYSEGIVESNGVVSIGSKETQNDIAVIGGKKYKMGAVDLIDYLGAEIKFFYKSVDGTDEILWFCPGDYNKTLVIRSEDLITDDPTYGFSKIVYYEDDKEKTANIDDFADIIYNNALSNDTPMEFIKPRSGEIKLINNDSDKDYEVIIVKEYTNMFVDSVFGINGYISSKYGESLNLVEYQNVRIFGEDGNLITTEEISPGRVISYVANPNSKEFIYIYENGAGVTAQLSTVTNDGEDIYGFEGTELKLSNSLKDAMANGTYYVPKIEVGKRYTYHTDMDGNIAAIKDAGLDEQYAYFIEAHPSNDPFGAKGGYEVKMLLADGTMAYTSTAKEFKQGGFSDGTDLTQKRPQVVKASFNSDGEIKKIDFATPLDREAYPFGFNKDEFTIDYAPSRAYVRNNVFNNSYTIDGNTLIFVTYVDDFGEEIYKVVGTGSIMGEKTYQSFWRGSIQYDAPKFYDADEYMHANVMSICIGYGGYVNRDALLLVDELVRYVNGDGSEYVRVKGLKNGVESEFVVEESLVPKDLKRGDIVAASIFDSKVYRLEKTFRLSDKDFEPVDETEPEGNSAYTSSSAYGYMYSTDGANVVLYNPSGWKNGKKLLVSSTQNNWSMRVSIYDAKNDKVYPGKINELYQNCTPQADGTIEIDENSTRIYISRRLGYIQSIIAVYY